MINLSFKYISPVTLLVSFLLFNKLMAFESDIDSIQKYIYNEPLKAKHYAYKYLRSSHYKNNDEGVINAFNYLASINNIISYPDSAFYFYDKAIIKSYDINNDELVMRSKNNKAGFLYQHYDFNNSLALYNEALLLAEKLKVQDYAESIKLNIARIKFEIGNYEEVLTLFKNQYSENTPPAAKATLEYYIAKTYLHLDKPDSSFQFIKKGLEYSTTYNDREIEIFFLNEYSIYLIAKEKYKEADSILKIANRKSEQIKSLSKKAFISLTKAKLRRKKGEIQSSINELIAILNLKDEIKFAPEELSEYYKLLAENYKEIDSVEQSNYYYQRHIEEENKKHNKKFNTIQDLHELDLNKIKKEKESYFKQRKLLSALVILLFGVLSIFFIIYKRRQKTNEKKFESLMNKIELYEKQKKDKVDNFSKATNIVSDKLFTENDNEITDNIDEDPEKNEDAYSQFVIKDEKISQILNSLEKLEKKKYFLRLDFTLHYAAKKLKTNTAYLSKIVNNELGKNFSTYLNELRINYIILELKNNPKLRAYSVNSIAEEIGYKSVDSFTKYFKAATGITPSVYIKKINDLNNKNVH